MLLWNDDTFSRLKEAFTLAPVLRQPDLELPFIVEVDAKIQSGISPRDFQCVLGYHSIHGTTHHGLFSSG